MLPTHTIKHPPRRNRIERRSAAPGSNGIFTSLRKLVTAPLNWFAVNPEFEQVDGKRKINGLNEGRLAGYAEGSQAKKIRVDPPVSPIESAYLDPPSSSFEPAGLSQPIKQLYLNSPVSHSFENNTKYVPRLSPFKDRRTMSIDPAPRESTVPRDPPMTRETSRIQLSHDFSADRRMSMSVAREHSMPPPPAPFRLRTSLTPKPSPTKPLRREASAPPPLASLMSNPIFVKRPSQEPPAGRNLTDQTPSLGSSMEFRHMSRSPTRERIAGAAGPSSRFPSQIPYGATAPVQVTNSAGRLLQELDVYKTPILPSRYKDAKVIPDFLKPKKVHVPIPMARKGRDIKPSLGRTEKDKVASNSGKPYAGQGGLKALLARRKAEEDELLATADVSHNEPKQMVDVGVSAKLTSDSEDDRRGLPKSFQPTIAQPSNEDVAHYRRERYSGRIGPTRTARRERPAVVGRNRNKFSAVFDEDDAMTGDHEDLLGASSQAVHIEEKRAPMFEAPPGFTFANDTPPIMHDVTNAKEPAIPALPFSLTAAKKDIQEAREAPTPMPQAENIPVPAPLSSGSQRPFMQFTQPAALPNKTEVSAAPTSTPAPPIPTFTLLPPTPDQPSMTQEKIPEISIPAEPKKPSISAPIPNFFANSAFLNSKPQEPPKPAVPSPTMPVKDAENPLWDGDKSTKPSAQPEAPKGLFASGGLDPPAQTEKRARSTSPKPPPFNGFNIPSSIAKSALPAPVIAQALPDKAEKPASSPFSFNAPTPTPPPVLPPASSSENQSATQAPSRPTLFSFGSSDAVTSVSAPSTSAGPPAPFTGFPSLSTAPASSAPSTLPFSFGAPPTASSPARPATADATAPTTATPSITETPFKFGTPTPVTPATGFLNSQKSPFSFGSAPATPPAQVEKKEPTFSFGAPSTTAAPSPTPFTFGLPAATAPKIEAPVPTTSPFNLGAPARAVTPPRNEDNEMRMEESPTRDLTTKSNAPELKVSTGFSFGAPTSAPFQASTGSGFTFGAPSTTSQPDNKPMGFGNFNRTTSAPASSTPFSFGQKTQSTTSSFGAPPSLFGQPTTGSSNAFSFGAPTAPTAAPASPNPFAPQAAGQPSPSTPSSPSTFGTSGQGFSFGVPAATNISNPFSFGSSQPSSPAVPNPGLPSSTTGPSSTFSFGQTAATSTPNPFGLSSGGATTGGSLFNIGAAPPSSGARQVKKLPRRGAGAKR